MNKTDKLENVLLRLILNQELAEQSQIQEKLRENGIDIPQSTLSRWLKKLNIVKVNHRYIVLSHESLGRTPVLSIKASLPNLIVLQTLPGQANALGYQIDQRIPKAQETADDPYAGVLGTLAGDDTLLIVMSCEATLLAFKEKLGQNFENYYVLYD